MKNKMPVQKIALAQKVSRVSVWKIQQAYKKYGLDALRDHKPGRLFEPLNPKFYKKVIDEWKVQRCGARKLHRIFCKKGFSVSLWKISQVLKAEGLQKPCKKRQKPRKYRRYEWPLPNLMWHTDWYELSDGKWLVVYIDDCTRKIMSHGVFENATSRNALLVLHKAIAEHKVTPFMLNSDKGTQFYANKRDKQGNADHSFEQELELLGIQFVPSRTKHPQTNGKTERWFGIFATEYDDRFKTVDEFVKWYNTKRASEAIDYQSPDDKYYQMLS